MLSGNVEELLQRIREKLASRGARGIFALGKSFRIIDDDNSFSIEFHEFKKAMNDYRMGMSEEETKKMFGVFDTNHDGSIDYNEFLRGIRGPMNEARKVWVKRAFAKMDKDGNGKIELNDIKGVYNAKMHPDVKSGRRTEDDVLLEFLETFEVHHNIMLNKANDHIVTPEEFEEYYNNISMSIDNDEYFALMMKNAWRLDEADRTYEKGWKGEEESKATRTVAPQLTSLHRASPRKGANNASSIDNTLNLGAQLYNRTHQPEEKRSLDVDQACEAFRKKLVARGARSIIGMSRQFRIMDDDNSHKLDFAEFTKAIKDYRVGVDEATVKLLFDACDKDKSGEVDYDEFIRTVRGPMNESRKKLVEAAFTKLDKDGNGVLEVSDIKGTYSAKNHPDVKSGRKSEDEVLGDFLETFEMHLNLGGGVRDRKITREEFFEYYNNVSASIDDDKYFEQMMISAWKLQGEDIKKAAWKADYGGAAAGVRGSPQKTGAPYGVSAGPVDYRSAARAQQEDVSHEEFKKRPESAATAPAGSAPAPKVAAAEKSPEKAEAHELLHTFRQCLASRGARGIFGLARVFRVCRDIKKRRSRMTTTA